MLEADVNYSSCTARCCKGRGRCSRQFKARDDSFVSLSDEAFRYRYRIATVIAPEICDLLAEDLNRMTHRYHALSVETQLPIALRFYATASF